MQAVDLVTLHPITRDELIQQLCAVHARTGEPYGVGLGFYVGLRFHVDSRKFRTWGINDEGGIACVRSYQIAHAKEAGVNVANPANAAPPVPAQPAAPQQQPQSPAPQPTDAPVVAQPPAVQPPKT